MHRLERQRAAFWIPRESRYRRRQNPSSNCETRERVHYGSLTALQEHATPCKRYCRKLGCQRKYQLFNTLSYLYIFRTFFPLRLNTLLIFIHHEVHQFPLSCSAPCFFRLCSPNILRHRCWYPPVCVDCEFISDASCPCGSSCWCGDV